MVGAYSFEHCSSREVRRQNGATREEDGAMEVLKKLFKKTKSDTEYYMEKRMDLLEEQITHLIKLGKVHNELINKIHELIEENQCSKS